MKSSSLVFVLASAVWAASAAQTPADLLTSTLAKMDAAASGFKGMTADLKKVTHTDVIGEDDVETGTLAVKQVKAKDLRMRADVKEPAHRTACFADRRAEVYNPKTNSVQVYDVGKQGKVLVDQFFLLGFGSNSADILSAYTVKLGGPETVNGQKAVRLELTPKSSDMLASIKKVELWISDMPGTSGLALQQKFYQGKDYNMAIYSNIRLNANLPDSAVKCDLPKNVRREPVRVR